MFYFFKKEVKKLDTFSAKQVANNLFVILSPPFNYQYSIII
tara:strand:+ start:6745 stop:6867 length:123 start_codon:yes stop_codon:yes gene_type:complete